ncbi:tape measure domain-containing protein [Rhizobium mesoamericanum]|uniref:tape measure protein n=1 Tax=Rhizobium mesoamericanum TaxID=1079800 RepID=UPI00278823F1|nr:tape measure protein [Rhizobium mesoamericanum]MDQ0558305.1 tape measure domain-containing protein [Rhizobium mesoamericanum]
MAATDLERLVVQLSADITKYERAMNRASSVGNKQLASIERRALSMNKNLAASFTSLGTKVGIALAGAFSVKGLSELQDAYTKIQNSLKVAGLSGQELTGVYNQLYAAAQKNAAPIEALATLYSRVAINQKELGVTSSQVVGLTDTVAMALKAQGSSAEEAQGALLQLSQALGSGKVQAEEYNSLIDGLPVLLQAAAAGIRQAGGSVAKLTQLVKSGQLASKALFDGIEAGRSVIGDKLVDAVQTGESSLILLRNALTNAAGKFDLASGSSAKFTQVIGDVAHYLDTVSFDNFIAAINNVVTALDGAISKFTTFLEQAGKAGGITPDVVEQLNKYGPDTDREVYDYLYGGGKQRQEAEESAKRQLDIQKQINELENSPVGNSEILRQLRDEREAILAAKQEAAASGPGAIRKAPAQGPLNFQGPVKPAVAASPVDITDPKYAVAAAGSGKGKKSRLDEYEREVKQVQERTASLNAQTAAQAELNPYVNDYGYNVERSATAQDLLTAAQNAGTAAGKELKDVQQLLSGNFDNLSPKAKEQAEAMLALANASGQAVAKSEELAESQDRLRQNMEDWRDVSKDATKGFIQDLISGKSAIDALGGALEKLGNKLLDQALDGIFGFSGSNNWFSSIFSGGGGTRIPGFASGTDFAPGGIAMVGEKGPELVNLPRGSQVIPNASLPKVSKAMGGNSHSITYAPVIDARGADSEAVARLERILAKERAEFSAKVVRTVKDAQGRRML